MIHELMNKFARAAPKSHHSVGPSVDLLICQQTKTYPCCAKKAELKGLDEPEHISRESLESPCSKSGSEGEIETGEIVFSAMVPASIATTESSLGGVTEEIRASTAESKTAEANGSASVCSSQCVVF